ncbi:hypothetical protein A8L44_07170 [Bacillus sp. FJAT-27986]|nr:hypothetical protein A8L44_07170 [Bacillus sp. FJAT-27986]
MVQTLRHILIIIIGLIAAYGLITRTFDDMSSFIPPLLCLLMMVWALEEYQKKRLLNAGLLFIFSLFPLFVSVQILFLN